MLVLGESHDLGWTATVTGTPGAGSLGHPVLVDGFANGWRVGASTLAAVGGKGSFEVTLRFAPQRELDVAFLVSLAAGLACLVIVAVSMVRRRQRRHRDGPVSELLGADDGADTSAYDGAGEGAGEGADEGADGGADPVVVSPIGEAAPQRGRATTIAIALGCGAVGLFVGGPVTGAVLALAVFGATRLRWGRGVLTLGALLAMATAAVTIVAMEYVRRYVAGPGWPSHFDVPAEIVWIAVSLLAADAGIELVRRRNDHRRTPDDRADAAVPNDQVNGT
jgi:hypothetical protein